MGLTAFTRDVAITQGRIEPANWTPQDAGAWVFGLGRDDPGIAEVLNVGDSVLVSQAFGWSGGGYVLRAPARLRPPSTIPLGVWWRASLLVDGVEVIGHTIPPARPGQPAGTLDFHDFGCVVALLTGTHTIGFRLQLQGTAGEYEVEIPAFYVDALTFDAVASTPKTLNHEPEANAIQVLADASIHVDLADIGTDGIDLTNTTITVGGVTAYAAGAFQAGFTGPFSAVTNPQPHVSRIVIDPLATWPSATTVAVHVATQTLSSAHHYSETYSFTTEYLQGPTIATAVARDQFTIRLTVTGAPLLLVDGSGSTAGDALTAAYYAIAIDPLPAGLAAASLEVVGVALVSQGASAVLDLTTDTEMSPGAPYVVTADGIRDVYRNTGPTSCPFDGWQPPVPAGRDFNLYEMLPQKNRDEDDTGDLQKFCAVLQDVLDLQLYDIDRIPNLVDIGLAPAAAVAAMLADLGNPFTFPLSVTDQRRLVPLLVPLYKQKGIDLGIVNAARLFLGVTATIVPVSSPGWILGVSRLDVDAKLGTTDPFQRNSFDVVTTTTLTTTQLTQLTAIVNLMKAAWLHLRNVVQPSAPPPPYNPLVLGTSRLDIDWKLH